jgi:hypothetical protein
MSISIEFHICLVFCFQTQAKERLSGFGHPVLDGLELMYIFACFDSMPIAVAESIRALLDRVEGEMSEQRRQSIVEPAAASSVSVGTAAASKYSFWPFSGSSASSASSTSSSASVLAWPVADTARLALIRGCIHSALKQSDGAALCLRPTRRVVLNLFVHVSLFDADAIKNYALVIAEEKALKKCARAKADVRPQSLFIFLFA